MEKVGTCHWKQEYIENDLKRELSVIKCLYDSQNFIIKTQSEAWLDGKVLLVHVMAEVMSLEMRFETRKSVTLSQLVW